MAISAHPMGPDAFCIWVVYGQPSDFPDHVVIRRQYATRSGEVIAEPIAALYDTLDQARADLPLDLACLLRHPDDDAAIIETWI